MTPSDVNCSSPAGPATVARALEQTVIPAVTQNNIRLGPATDVTVDVLETLLAAVTLLKDTHRAAAPGGTSCHHHHHHHHLAGEDEVRQLEDENTKLKSENSVLRAELETATKTLDEETTRAQTLTRQLGQLRGNAERRFKALYRRYRRSEEECEDLQAMTEEMGEYIFDLEMLLDLDEEDGY